MYRILIVDDHSCARASINASLQAAWRKYAQPMTDSSQMLDVHCCTSMKELDAEKDFACDAIILDLDLGDSTPAETLAWLDAHTLLLPPVICITHHQSNGNADAWLTQSIASGAADFVSKPDMEDVGGAKRLLLAVIKSIARAKYHQRKFCHAS